MSARRKKVSQPVPSQDPEENLERHSPPPPPDNATTTAEEDFADVSEAEVAPVDELPAIPEEQAKVINRDLLTDEQDNEQLQSPAVSASDAAQNREADDEPQEVIEENTAENTEPDAPPIVENESQEAVGLESFEDDFLILDDEDDSFAEEPSISSESTIEYNNSQELPLEKVIDEIITEPDNDEKEQDFLEQEETREQPDFIAPAAEASPESENDTIAAADEEPPVEQPPVEEQDPVMLKPGQKDPNAEPAAESEEQQKPNIYMASRRAFLAASNNLPIDLPDTKDASDEINHALAAFSDLQYGQTGFIRLSVRSQPGMKEQVKSWLRARKAGEDPDAQPKSVSARILSGLRYLFAYSIYAVNESNNPGSREKPVSPFGRGKNLAPLPASQVDNDEKQAWKEAESKANDTAHFETVLRVGAFGVEEEKDNLEAIIEETTSGMEAFSTSYQQVGWESGAPFDAALGLMGARQPANLGMVLSAIELGTMAHAADDLLNPQGVQVNKSQFKQLPLGNPITLDDPYQPEPGIIPIGIQNPRSDDRQFIGIANKQLDQHLIISGKTGSGKSEWMKWIVFGVAKANYPLVLIDPHGQLSDEILNALMINCPDRIDDIVYCDLSNSAYPVALNPLDVHSLEEVESTVHSVIEMLGSPKVALDKGGAPRAMVYAREALTALCHANLVLRNPHTKCTLLDVLQFFSDPEFRHMVVEFCQNESIRQKYDHDNGPFEQMGEKQQLEHVQPIIRAFSELGNSEAFSAVFSSPQNKLDFGRLIHGNKIVIVKLARFAAGGQAELGSFVGALILPWLLSSMGSWGRTKDPITGQQSGSGCRVMVDEAPTLIGANSSVPQVLAEARKWDLGLLMASQFLDQFDKTIIDAALANTASKVTFVQDPNKAGPITKAIAGASSRVTETDIASLPNYHFFGNILLPSGGGLAASGAFSAASLMPIEDKLQDQQLSIREQIISNSQALVANSQEEIRQQVRQRVPNIKKALITEYQNRAADTESNPDPLFPDDEDDKFSGWN